MRPVFSASRVQYISDLISEFALRPHYVWKYGIDIQFATAKIRRGKKEEERRRKKKKQDKKIISASVAQGVHN